MLSAKEEGTYFCKSIAIEMGGVSRYFLKALGSGVDVTLLLSGPLRLRVQSRSRTRLRIAASIGFLLRACLTGVLDTMAPLSRF